MTEWRMWSEPGWWATTITRDDAHKWWRRSRDVIDADLNHLKFLDGDFETGLFRVANHLPRTGFPGVRNLVVTLAAVEKFHVPPEGERDPESASEVLWSEPVPRENNDEGDSVTDKATTEEAEAFTTEGNDFAISVGTLYSTTDLPDNIALRFMIDGKQHVAAISPANAVMVAQEMFGRAMGAGLKDYVPTLCLKHRDTQDQILTYLAISAESLITAGERLAKAAEHNTAHARAYGLMYAQHTATLLNHMNALMGLWIMCPEQEDTVPYESAPAETEPAPAEAEAHA